MPFMRWRVFVSGPKGATHDEIAGYDDLLANVALGIPVRNDSFE